MQAWVLGIVAINFSIFALANDNAFQNIEYDLFNNQPKTQTDDLLFESSISSNTQFLCNSNQAFENDQSDCSVQSFSVSDSNQTHLRLLDWLKKGNGYFDKIEIEEYSQDNRGLNAKQDIEANEIILLIPKTHLITLEMAKQTLIAQRLIENNINLLSPKHSYMSIFLLQEKRKLNSFWKPFIDILPKSYSNFPIFYSKNELEWLKDSRFLEQIKTRIQDLKKDYETICKIAPEFRANSFQDFCWARTSTCSRIFTITIGGVTTDSFVPVADMLNHEISASTTWSYSDKKNGFIVKAMSKIGQGQSISDSYGLKSNSRFLLNYGFTITKNNANDIDLIIDPNLNDNLLYIKEKLTKEKIGLTKTFKVVMQIEEKKVQEFMSYIRFITINKEDQLYQILNKQGQQYIKITQINFISISNELEMWIKIGQICKKQLDKYLTTYEQDQVILENQELTINQRNCLILRMGEKEILRFYIIFSQKMSLLLNHFNLNEIHQFLQKDKNYQYKKYIKSILIDEIKFSLQIKISCFIQSKFKCIEVFLSKRYITYSTFPIFYDESELKWLEGSLFLEHIDNKMTEHKQDYDEIYQAVPEFRVYSFQDFCWAKISTCSRIYEVTINETDTFAYIPLADMINHVNPPETYWFYSDEQEGFILQADERIQKGKQVFDSYGAKSNLILLLNYGFVEDNNGANEIDVKVFPSIDDRLLQLKQDLTYENLKTTKFFKLLFDTENFEVQEFMSYIRFITIKNEDQLYQILNKQGQQYIKITQINFISISNELQMWIKIGQICKTQLDQYPTTYEQDQVILENQKLTINQRNCLILRMGEKEILRFYIIFSQKMSLLLNQFNLNEIHQFLQQDKNYQYKKYIKNLSNIYISFNYNFFQIEQIYKIYFNYSSKSPAFIKQSLLDLNLNFYISYSTFPIFYDESELKWLEGSFFLEHIDNKVTEHKQDYDEIYQAVPEFRVYSFQDFCWAKISTGSRIFGITINESETSAYVPLADMINHVSHPQTIWFYSDEQEGFIVQADERIQKGEQVFDSYGAKSNLILLLNYGFVEDNNGVNEIDIKVFPNIVDRLLQLKEELTYKNLKTTKFFKLLFDTENFEVQEFMSYIRFIIIKNEDQLYQILKKQGQQYIKITQINFISISNELQMWIKIGQICKTQLDQYPTTYEQDQVIFENQELTINQRNCLILRMGEKEILRFYIIFSQKMSFLLKHFNLNEIHQFLQQDENYQYKKYIKSVLIQI